MALLLFLDTWLITRLWFTFRDQPLPPRQWLLLGLVQLLLIGILTPSLAWLWLALAVVGSLVLSEAVTARDHVNEARLAGTFVVLGVALGLHWQDGPETWVMGESQLQALYPLLLGLLGFLLVANETNLAIRALLHRFQMEPTTQDEAPSRTVDDREYNAGRVIGILERWLIYLVMVVAQNYNVIALVLAAKGFARFRQLDQREFAEYVLIGTLASILFTVLIAQLITYLL